MQYIPSIESIPHAAQMMRLRPADPVSSSTPFGDTKIPEPRTIIAASYSRSDSYETDVTVRGQM